MRNIADPNTPLEATALIEAIYARVFAASLKEDVVTVPGSSYCKRSVNNCASMALAPKPGMSDNIFQKPVLPPAS